MWIFIEWFGAFLALSGSFIMSNKKISPLWAWSAWILNNFLYIALFTVHTKQYGLLFMQCCGFVINTLGFLQWAQKKEINKKILVCLSSASLLCLIVALGILPYLILYPNLQYLEWSGALLSIAAAFLLASKHRMWTFCWLIWLASNLMILTLAIYNQQFGLIALQVGFTVANTYGTWVYFFKKQKITSSD